MTLIVDSGPLISASDRRDPLGPAMRRLLTQKRERILTVAPVVSEVEHLLTVRFGAAAASAFLADLARGSLPVECLEPQDYATIVRLGRQYRELGPGLTDLAVVALAARFDTRRVVTFDQRHFRVLQPLQGGSFTLLPWDEA